MSKTVTRREFVQTSTAGLAIAAAAPVFGQAPAVQSGGVRPVVVASANGNRYKNGGTVTGVQRAFEMMTKGTDVLDAVIAGVNLCELDPEDTSVGYGGLPNAEGVVQLDSCCMHGPTKRAGGVACLEGIRTPSLVAKAVLEQTDHHLIVGKDAQTFARQLGFKIEDDLNTETITPALARMEAPNRSRPLSRSEEAWRSNDARRAEHGPRRLDRSRALLRHDQHGWRQQPRRGFGRDDHQRARVEDSRPRRRLADSRCGTLCGRRDRRRRARPGRGEANLYNLCSYLIVEEMRRGRHPKDAGLEALRRVQKNTIEKRLLNARGLPNFGLNFYILNAKGEYAGVSMYEGNYAVCTEKGPETVATTPLLEGRASD